VPLAQAQFSAGFFSPDHALRLDDAAEPGFPAASIRSIPAVSV
jgi:hypothetical protein